MRITAFEYGLLDCGYLSPKVYDVVKAFIELARTECDIAIVLLRSKFLLSAGSLGLRKQERFKVLSLSAIKFQYEVALSITHPEANLGFITE